MTLYVIGNWNQATREEAVEVLWLTREETAWHRPGERYSLARLVVEEDA